MIACETKSKAARGEGHGENEREGNGRKVVRGGVDRLTGGSPGNKTKGIG